MNMPENFLSRAADTGGAPSSGNGGGNRRKVVMAGGTAAGMALAGALLYVGGFLGGAAEEEIDAAAFRPPARSSVGGPAQPVPAVSAIATSRPAKLTRLSGRNPFAGLGAVPASPSAAPSAAPSPTPTPTATSTTEPTPDVIKISIYIDSVAEDNTSARMKVNGSSLTAVPGDIVRDAFRLEVLQEGRCAVLQDGAGEQVTLCEGDFRTYYFYSR